MRKYELLFILKPTLQDDQTAAFQGQVSSAVSRAKGRILEGAVLGKRKLSYPIANAGEGIYLLVKCELEADQIAGLEKSLKVMDGVLRLLVTRDTGIATPPPLSEEVSTPKAEGSEFEQEAATRRVEGTASQT
ncbi:MAG: 30S ribosomal protein S6 [Candidatus Omnitrophica bacterium]|nr:30S ribosomal protein S6 [Candidatus Omnitrophota bacterium]